MKEVERKVREGLIHRRDRQAPQIMDEDIEVVDFPWRHRKVHSERFLRVSLDDEDPFARSSIFEKCEAPMKLWDDEMKKTGPTRRKLVQLLTAKAATEKALTKSSKIITDAYAEIYQKLPSEWAQMIKDCEEALNEDAEYKERYAKIIEKWNGWERQAKHPTEDKMHINRRNEFAASKANQILRRPMYPGDEEHSAIYMAFDVSWNLLVFLDPEGMQFAYEEESIRDEPVHEVLRQQSHDFYTKVRRPASGTNVRHISQEEHLRRNPDIKVAWCGSDHYG